MEKLKVSSKSNPNSVAGAIAGTIREENNEVELIAVGAGAVNQAIKATAIARGYLIPSGIDIVCIPSFSQTKMDDYTNEYRTCIKILVKSMK